MSNKTLFAYYSIGAARLAAELNDDDVIERPDLMPKLSPEFKTSCHNLVLFIHTFINEGENGNYPAQMALAMMFERAKDELCAAQGWE